MKLGQKALLLMCHFGRRRWKQPVSIKSGIVEKMFQIINMVYQTNPPTERQASISENIQRLNILALNFANVRRSRNLSELMDSRKS